MPGPPKSNAKNSTGIVLEKHRIKSARNPDRHTPKVAVAVADTDQHDKFIKELLKSVQALSDRLHIVEQKINNLKVDTATEIVTFNGA